MDRTLKVINETSTHVIAGGYGVVFGGVDLEGETFTADTDFMLGRIKQLPVFFDHTLESVVQTKDGSRYVLKGIDEPLGKVIEITPDDVGLYMRLMFEKQAAYWPIAEAMLDSGKAGLSTGPASHLVRYDGPIIKRWPIVETSITLTPAEPRTIGVERLKQLMDDNEDIRVLVSTAEHADNDTPQSTPEAEPEARERGDAGKALQLKAQAYLSITEG